MAPVLQECPICLDRFRDPVVTPCGHLSCGACMGTHVRASRDPYEATCPTCRAPFPIVAPDLSLIPKKYHVFISPSLRRVYLGDGEDTSRVIIDCLNTEITLLTARVGTLKRDKDLLMDRCEAAQSAVLRLTSDERTARLELVKARADARLANQSFDTLKDAYRSLESAHSECTLDTKRKSGQAALDSSTSIDSPSPSPRKTKVFSNGRPVRPMPKRVRLQQTTTTAGPTAQRPPAPTPRFADPEVVGRPSVSFSSSSSSSSPSPSASTGPGTTAARRTRVAHYATSSSSDSDEPDGHGDAVASIHRYRTRSRTGTNTRVIDYTVSPPPFFLRVRQERSTVN